MKLSILIPSMKCRRESFTRLMYVLHSQLTSDVELIVDVDCGEMVLGTKRQRLLEQSHGDYVAFIDDDDLVAGTYIEDILEATDRGPDAIGFMGEIRSTKNNKTRTFKMSMENPTWSRDIQGNFNRGIQHLSPVRRDIALKAGFPDINQCEDHKYSIAVTKLVKTEIYIDKVLYKYLTRSCV